MSNRQLSVSEVRWLSQERSKLDSLYFIKRSMSSIEGLNLLLKKRRKFYQENNWMLGEFVLWGKYLLTYRGTIQEIDQKYLCGKPVELTTLADFTKMLTSLRTKEVEIPKITTVCTKCHELITIKDVANGNFELRGTQFIHKNHN